MYILLALQLIASTGHYNYTWSYLGEYSSAEACQAAAMEALHRKGRLAEREDFVCQPKGK
jgi:hypothetical protein